MNINILNTEILDYAVDNFTNDGYKQVQPSEISVLVQIEVKNIKYRLNFQTQETSDYGAFSDILKPVHDSGLEQLLNDFCLDEAEEIINKVEVISKVNEEWHDYVNENIILANSSHCNFIDANSVRNIAYRKEYVIELVKNRLEEQKKECCERDTLTIDEIEDIIFGEDDVVEEIIDELEISENANLEELRDLQHAMINNIS